MKVTFIVLGLTCLFGTFHALPLQEEDQADEIGTFLGIEPEIIPVEEQELEPEFIPDVEEEIEPEILPSFEEVVEDVDRWQTTTRRPQTTRRPRPPQIHDNAYKSQGKMSARLTNVVYNRGGDQKTMQRNRIQYNLNAVRRALEQILGHEDSE